MIHTLAYSFNYSKEKFSKLKGKVFQTEKSIHKPESEDDSEEKIKFYLTYVNSQLYSLFSNCKNYFEKKIVSNANGLYPHSGQLSNNFNSSALSNKSFHASHGHSFHPFSDRANSLGAGITI